MAVMKKEETGRQENGWHKLKIGSNVENRQEQVIEFGQINKILNTKLTRSWWWWTCPLIHQNLLWTIDY